MRELPVLAAASQALGLPASVAMTACCPALAEQLRA
jgi:hypothetical protein